MKEIAAAAFLVDFKRELIQIQGFISFSLLAYWIGALWTPLLEKMRSSRAEAIWVALCLCFGIFIATACAMEWGNEYFLISISLGLSIGLAMCHSTVAICLLASLLFLRPWELVGEDDYFLILPKLTYGICVGHLLIKITEKKGKAINWNICATLLLSFAFWAYVTTFKAPNPLVAQIAYFETLFKGVFLFLMVMNTVSSRLELKTLSGTIVLSFLAVGLISVYQTVGIDEAFREGSARLKGIGAFGNSNDVAALMVLVFPFSMLISVRKATSPLFRLIAVASMVIVVAAIYLSQSRGAMIGLAAIVALYAISTIRNKALTTLIVGAALLAVPAYIAVSSRSSADLEESSSSRMTYMEAGMWMGLKNPVLGVGFGAFPMFLSQYARRPLTESAEATAHNSWVLCFAENGALGLLVFALLFGTSARLAWQVYPEAPEFFLSVVGYGIAMTFLSHTYLIYPYLLYALVGAAHKIFYGAYA